MLRTVSRVTAVAVGFVSAGLATAAPMIDVDTFSNTTAAYPLVNVVPLSSPGVNDVATSAIGGRRLVQSFLAAADAVGLDAVSVGVFPAALTGIYDFSSTTGATASSTLSYGSFISIGGVPLGLSIPDGSTADLSLLSFDLPQGQPLSISVRVLSGSTVESVSGLVTSAGPQLVSIPLDGISAAVRGNVSGLSFQFDAPRAADFRLDKIALVIPEPAALGLLAPAAVLLTRRRK